MSDRFVELLENLENNYEKIAPLIVKPMPQWKESYEALPPTKRLFGNLIFDKELTILFGDSNVGKSLFAYSISEQISGGFAAMPQYPTEKYVKVLYLDCELSQRQLYNRYKGYEFSQYFIRAEINTDYKGTTIEALQEQLRLDKEIEFVIIDNITYLCNEAENGNSAIDLMHKLIEIKRKYDVGILVLTHVPKLSPKEPLTQNSMSGSKNLANLADSIFCIGKSYKQGFEFLRYIKQIKCRNAEIDENTVTLIQLTEQEPFLHHSIYGTAKEYEHLKRDLRKADTDTDIQTIQKVIEEMQSNGESVTVRSLAEKTGFGKTKVNDLQRKLSNYVTTHTGSNNLFPT